MKRIISDFSTDTDVIIIRMVANQSFVNRWIDWWFQMNLCLQFKTSDLEPLLSANQSSDPLSLSLRWWSAYRRLAPVRSWGESWGRLPWRRPVTWATCRLWTTPPSSRRSSRPTSCTGSRRSRRRRGSDDIISPQVWPGAPGPDSVCACARAQDCGRFFIDKASINRSVLVFQWRQVMWHWTPGSSCSGLYSWGETSDLCVQLQCLFDQ